MKKFLALLLALTMAFPLAACGGGAAPTDPATEPQIPVETEPVIKEVTLNIAYTPGWSALWAIATAQAKGYFAEEDIILNLTQFMAEDDEIAALKDGSMDIAYIEGDTHKRCSTGSADVVLLQNLDDCDCIIGLNGITTLEELKGKTIGYTAGTSSETILTAALTAAGLTMEDVEALPMEASALKDAALAGTVDAVAVRAPRAQAILSACENAAEICSNIDFSNLATPGSWVANPKWADENRDVLLRFIRAMYRGMDAAASADDAVAEEVADYIVEIIGFDSKTVLSQRYDASWKTSAEIIEMVNDATLIKVYADQQNGFISAGILDGATALLPESFVLTDLMLEAAG